jgi:(E)-4-hydroxy-3-methylbut-2-enyl-diphosphate synthase
MLTDAANVRAGKEVFSFLQEHKIDIPVIVAGDYSSETAEDFLLYAAADFGSYFIDGYGDGVLLEGTPVEAETANRILFGILQAAGVRITKTEFIACPSCGRTQFNLMETANAVKQRTAHLKGLKIGIMGCIVNGPGEMADADYGYVGSGKDKVTLYRGQEIVGKNIPSDKALDLLIELIKHDGRWRDP